MRGLRGAITAKRFRHPRRAVRDDQVSQYAPEELQRRLGLVIGDLVSALVDPREAEVAVLSALAVLFAVDHERRIPRGLELGAVRVV